MKLVLIEGMAYLIGQGYVPTDEPLKVDIDIPGYNISEYKMSVKINELPSRSCTNSFNIPVDELKKAKLQIAVTITNKRTQRKATFPMDPLNLRLAVLVGGNIEDQYPSSLAMLREDMKNVKETVNLIRKAVVEIGKRGEIL